MKIAITGRLSRRNGHNIRVIPKMADVIQPCDLFINNAQAGYAQTELLFAMADRWQGTKKHIIVISTQMTQSPVSSLPGLDMDQYRIQKIALEESVRQLRNRDLGIKFTIIRPGNIATSLDKTVPPAADVDNWANTLIDIFELARIQNLRISDISLGPV
jgi:NADP-dependent 3-hydroxy acid dehydrogenase YdfG